MCCVLSVFPNWMTHDVRQMPVARPPFAVDGDGGCLTHDMAALLSSHRTN